MAKSRRLALVILATVPLMKHTPSIRVRTHVPALLLVAWRISSTMGMPVELVKAASGSVRQNNMARMKARPLHTMIVSGVSHLKGEGCPHVTPPTPIAYTIARGASREGFGISSVMCKMTSKAMRERADCSRPKSHDIPSDQPVSLLKVVKTNSASVLSCMESKTMVMTTTPRMDHATYTILVSMAL